MNDRYTDPVGYSVHLIFSYLGTECISEPFQIFGVVARTSIFHVLPDDAEEDNVVMTHRLEDLILAERLEELLGFDVDGRFALHSAICRRRHEIYVFMRSPLPEVLLQIGDLAHETQTVSCQVRRA